MRDTSTSSDVRFSRTES